MGKVTIKRKRIWNNDQKVFFPKLLNTFFNLKTKTLHILIKDVKC